MVDLLQAVRSGWVYKDSVHQVQKVIARCALNWPLVAKSLIHTKNLLDHRVHLTSIFRFSAGLRRNLFPQLLKVGQGVKKAVDVVDTQAGYLPLLHQSKNQCVRQSEDDGIGDPHPDQVVNGEEPSVIDLFVGESPESKQ